MAGGVFEQADWPDSRGDYVEVCDGCRTVIWSTCWNEESSDGFDVFDAFLRTNGWRDYIDPCDSRVLNLCPACAVRALQRGEIRTLADWWIRPVRAYTHADQEVDAQLSARALAVTSLLLTGRGAA